MKRKVLSILMAICMALSLMPVAALAANGGFSDMPAEDSWSYAALKAAIDNGLLTGADGMLLPNGILTRAQMAAIVNRAFGAADFADISGYNDVPATAWYRTDIAKAVRMGTFKGSGFSMRPDDPVTRQEAFVALARAFKLADGDTSALSVFSDGGEVLSWAAPSVAAMVEAGYLTGDGGLLSPTADITRAEFAKVMSNMVAVYCRTSGTYTQSVTGNLLVNAPGVTLKALTVTGDLIIGEGVGDGEVTLDGVTVTGRIVVRGGGVNSIILTNKSSAGSIVVGKTGDGGVRIHTEEGCQVDIVYVDDGKDDVILAGTFSEVKIEADTPVSLKDASVKNLTIQAEGANVKLEGSTTVDAAIIPGTAAGAKLEVGTGSTVTKVDSAAQGVKLQGEGTVKTAAVSGSNTAVDIKGAAVTVTGDATGVTQNGTSVTSSTTTTTSSGGGSSGGGSSGSSSYTASVDSEAELAAALADSDAKAIRISGNFALADRETYTNEDVWAKPVTILSGVTFTVGQNRSLIIESTLTNSGTIAVLGGTTIDNYGVLAMQDGGSCINNGTITLGGASIADGGSPNGAALRLFDATLENDGTITSSAGSDAGFWGGFVAVVDASTLTNKGTITLNGMSLLALDYTLDTRGTASLINDETGTLTAADSACKIEIRDGGLLETVGTMSSAGDLIIGAEDSEDVVYGAAFVIEDSGALSNTGTITVRELGANALVILGTLTNSGTVNNLCARINMIGTLNNTGTINNEEFSEFLVQDSAAMNGLDIDNNRMTALVFSEGELRSMMTVKGYTHIRLEDEVELATALTVPENTLLTVVATDGFVNLKLVAGATLTLSSGSELATESDFSVPAIAQIWVAGGTLDADEGSIGNNSTLYYTAGSMTLPAPLDESISVMYGVTTEEELAAALAGGVATGILIQDSFSVTGETSLSANTTVQDGVTLTVADGGALNVAAGKTLTVQALTGFTNLKIDTGGTVTLASGAQITTESDLTVPAIGQIWINGGTLDADAGSIGNGSTLYYVSGTMDLPTLDESVSVPFGVTDETGLTAALSAGVATNVLIQDSFSVTADTALAKFVTIQDGATLTVDTGKTLTVNPDVFVLVRSGSGLVNNGSITNLGSITIADGASYSGVPVTGDGSFTDENE